MINHATLTDAVRRLRLGERATLLQFSSAFCAPCRATRQVLSEVADVVLRLGAAMIDGVLADTAALASLAISRGSG